MGERTMLNIFSVLVIALLMVLTASGNAPVLFIAASLTLYFGFLLFPAQRGWGAIAAIASCVIALVAAAVLSLR